MAPPAFLEMPRQYSDAAAARQWPRARAAGPFSCPGRIRQRVREGRRQRPGETCCVPALTPDKQPAPGRSLIHRELNGPSDVVGGLHPGGRIGYPVCTGLFRQPTRMGVPRRGGHCLCLLPRSLTLTEPPSRARGVSVSYADQTLTCRDCGQAFTFTVGEQEFYASRGFTNEPSRCPDC